MPRRAWESRPGTVPPTPPVRPSPPLCDAMRHGQRQSRVTKPPTPVRSTCRTLERGRRSPRREDGRLLHTCTELRRDVGPAGPVTSVAIGPVRPSPPSPTPSPALHHHPQHCGGTGRQDASTPVVVCPASSRQPHPRAYVWAMTKRATPTTPPSKPLLDGYRAHHDAPPDARFTRTAVYSITLYTMPLHIDKIVSHTCKLPPPWPIKGGAVPQPQGEDKGALTRTLPAFTTILALDSISTSGTWRIGLLSRLACSPPLQALQCNTIQCPEHTPVGRTAPAGTRINPSVTSCLAPAIERYPSNVGTCRIDISHMIFFDIQDSFKNIAHRLRVEVIEDGVFIIPWL
jgi:hypothetical protein